jgi:hypothetical protein
LPVPDHVAGVCCCPLLSIYLPVIYDKVVFSFIFVNIVDHIYQWDNTENTCHKLR